MSRSLFHPSSRRLTNWLEQGDDDIDDHIDSCHRCAGRIEAISRPTPPLGDALLTTLAPPPDLQPRLRTGIAQKLKNQDELEFVLRFFTLPWSAVQAMSETWDNG